MKSKEQILFFERFTGGYFTVNGKYTLKRPFWFKGATIKLTESELLVTCVGIPLWKARLSDISNVQLKFSTFVPFRGKVNVSTTDGKGVSLYVYKAANLVEKLRGQNLQIQCEEEALKKCHRQLMP